MPEERMIASDIGTDTARVSTKFGDFNEIFNSFCTFHLCSCIRTDY
jgi:hypothetical protein